MWGGSEKDLAKITAPHNDLWLAMDLARGAGKMTCFLCAVFPGLRVYQDLILHGNSVLLSVSRSGMVVKANFYKDPWKNITTPIL